LLLHPPLPLPFPTRRSSDPMFRRVADQLPAYSVWKGLNGPKPVLIIDEANLLAGFGDTRDGAIILRSVSCLQLLAVACLILTSRSEERTSELQSRENLVCRL